MLYRTMYSSALLHDRKNIYGIGCQDKKNRNPINHRQSEIYIINANLREPHGMYV